MDNYRLSGDGMMNRIAVRYIWNAGMFRGKPYGLYQWSENCSFFEHFLLIFWNQILSKIIDQINTEMVHQTQNDLSFMAILDLNLDVNTIGNLWVYWKREKPRRGLRTKILFKKEWAKIYFCILWNGILKSN